MYFDVISAIHNRISTKHFHDSFLSETKREAIQRFIDSVGEGPFHSKTKFYLADIVQLPLQEINSLHLPKDITHAYTYIVGTVLTSEYDLEDFGYIFEKIILYATSLKLGTCWISSSLNRNRFAELIHVNAFELIPCVTPVGIPADYKLKNYASKNYAELIQQRNRKQKQYLFFENYFDTPIRFETSSKFLYALEMVRVAPSVKNKQPWRILFNPLTKAFHFYLEHSLSEIYLPQCEDVIDLQRIDIGIAMCHFDLTLQQLGIYGQWKIMDPGLPVPSNKTEYIATWIP